MVVFFVVFLFCLFLVLGFCSCGVGDFVVFIDDSGSLIEF